MPIDDRTSTQNYPKPNIANTLADDVGRLRTALDDIDSGIDAKAPKASPVFTGTAGIPLGSASAPSLYFTGDDNTGLYSPGADQVAISTGGAGRLFVDANGRVTVTVAASPGISTNGSIALTGAGDAKIYTTDGSGMYVDANTAGGMYLQSDGAFYIRGSAALSYAERLRITSDGKVGIGTSSPGAQFDILGTTPSLHVGDNTGGTPDYRGYSLDFSRRQQTGGINFTASSPSVFLDLYAGGSAANLGGWVGQIRFFTGGDSAYGTERARITSDGKVGIGTSSPGSYAAWADDLVISANGDCGITIVTTATETGTINFANGTSGTAAYRGFIYYYHNENSLKFGTNGTERLRITSDGNVGIGTSSPQASLHCSGAILASSSLAALSASNIFIDQPTSALSRIGVAGADSSTAGTLAISQYSSNGSVGRDVLQISASGTTTLTSAASTAPFIANIGTSEVARLDSSGRLLVGTSAARTNVYYGANQITPTHQYEFNLNSYNTGLSLINYNNTGYAPVLTFGLSQSATQGTNTAVNGPNTDLGIINFTGNDGTNFRTGASIVATTDTSVSTGDLPTRLVFSTTADGAASPTEAMRINNQRELLIGTTTRTANGGVLQVSNGITFPATQSACSDANTLDDYEEGTFTPTLKDGLGGTGTLSDAYGKYTKIGRNVFVQVYVIIGSLTGLTTNQYLLIGGAPFTCASNDFTLLSSPQYSGVAFSGYSVTGIGNSSTSFSFLEITSNTAYTQKIVSDFAVNDSIGFSGWYMV